MGSPERRDHLVREQSQALALERGRNHPARVRLEQDAVDAELGLEILEPLDQLRRRAERDLLGEHVVVREIRHALGLEAAALGRAGAGASHRGARQLGLPREEGRDALARLLERGALRRGGVDRNAHVGTRRPRVAGLAPRLAIGLERHLQVVHVRRAKADEDRQPEPAGHAEGLVRGGRHPNRWMRPLIRARRHRGVLKAIELARVAERLALPGLAQDRQGLVESRLALAVGHAVDVVALDHAAPTDSVLEPPLADLVDRRNLFGDAKRMVERQNLHGRADAKALGARRDRARHQERGRDHRPRRREVDLAEPDAVHAPGFGDIGEVERVVERRDHGSAAPHLLDEEPEVHGQVIPRGGLAWPRHGIWPTLAPARAARERDSSQSPRRPSVSQDKAQLVEILRQMIMIREFDLLAVELRTAKRIYGALHPYVGEEAVAVGVCAALRPTDRITSTHRGHGHCIAKGADINRMMAELFGRADGYCKGKGGSMHIADFAIGMLGANGIVAGGMPIACGAALAAQLEDTGAVAACFFGDGATGEGEFHETLNIASLWKLPLLFVCENNRYGAGNAVESVRPEADISLHAPAYGMPGVSVDGNDVLAVRDAARQAVERARRGDGPTLLHCKTFRWLFHAMRDAPQPDVRSADLLAQWRGRDRDPIARFEDVLIGRALVTAADVQAMREQVKRDLAKAVEFAEKSPYPDPKDLLVDMFAE